MQIPVQMGFGASTALECPGIVSLESSTYEWLCDGQSVAPVWARLSQKASFVDGALGAVNTELQSLPALKHTAVLHTSKHQPPELTLSKSKLHQLPYKHLLLTLAWSVLWCNVPAWHCAPIASGARASAAAQTTSEGVSQPKSIWQHPILNNVCVHVCVHSHTHSFVCPPTALLVKVEAVIQQHVASDAALAKCFSTNVALASSFTCLVTSAEGNLSRHHYLDLHHP